MGFFRKAFGKVKKLSTYVFNVRAWMDVPHLIRSTEYISALYKRVYTQQTPTPNLGESFEEAMVRLQLTEDTIAKRIREFKFLTYLFCIGALLMWAYFVWFMIQSSTRGMLATLGVGLVLSAQAFRYHFWLFQLKQRKLGCTLGYWFWVGIVGKKS